MSFSKEFKKGDLVVYVGEPRFIVVNKEWVVSLKHGMIGVVAEVHLDYFHRYGNKRQYTVHFQKPNKKFRLVGVDLSGVSDV